MIWFLFAKSNISKDWTTNALLFIEYDIKFIYEYKIVWCNDFIDDDFLKDIKPNDVVFWEPMLASNNMHMLKEMKKPVVLLEKPTVLIQEKSVNNHITENEAINNNFWIYYMNPDNNDITNRDWKLITNEDNWLLDKKKLNKIVEI
jgi:hypothetical protein